MAAETWHRRFFARHIERFHRGDWPAPESGFWDDWKRKLIKAGVKEDEARQASESMFDDGAHPDHVSQHPEALQAKVRELWQKSRPADVPSKPRSQIEEEEYNAEWNRKAREHWGTLEEFDREDWRKFVYERCDFIRSSKNLIELMAQAWAYDPSSVLPEMPREEVRPNRYRPGPRRIFEPIPFKE